MALEHCWWCVPDQATRRRLDRRLKCDRCRRDEEPELPPYTTKSIRSRMRNLQGDQERGMDKGSKTRALIELADINRAFNAMKKGGRLTPIEQIAFVEHLVEGKSQVRVAISHAQHGVTSKLVSKATISVTRKIAVWLNHVPKEAPSNK